MTKKNNDFEIQFVNVKKMSPTSSDVHVPSTGEEDKIKKHNRKMLERLANLFSMFMDEEADEGVNKDKLSTEGREHIKDSNFALPGERKYPIHDLNHARNALARASGKPEESKVKAAVYRKYPDLRKVAKSDGPLRLASIAMLHNGKILMGKRRDNGKWTTPGGHLDLNETFKEGAIREAMEETGVDVSKELLVPLDGVVTVKGFDGKERQIQPYKIDFKEKPKTSMTNDPDGEVYRWYWIDISKGELPAYIVNKMHTPLERNCLFKALLKEFVLKFDPIDALPELNNYDAFLAKAAMGEDEHTEKFGEAQKLIAAIDYEMERNKVVDPQIAREEAEDNLSKDPNYYENLWSKLNGTSDELEKDTGEGEVDADANVGLNLDLGSGHIREPGYLGVDTYPYDHGTVVHDLDLGIPFQTGCASKVRLCNVQMDDEDIKPLLSEIQRVLMPGGQFMYEGPNDIYNYPEWFDQYPHMVLTEHEENDVQKDDGNPSTIFRQKYTRLAQPDPSTANDAEPRIGVSVYDMLPSDDLIGVDALSYLYSDATSSGRGNRLHGYPSQGSITETENKMEKKLARLRERQGVSKIMKADKAKQIVYGVVLAPDEIDSQDDYMTEEDIEKTAHEYMKNWRKVGAQHVKEIKAIPVESYIAPIEMHFEGGVYGPQTVKKGSWVLGVHVADPKEWEKVENGEYTGYSVGGQGYRQEI